MCTKDESLWQTEGHCEFSAYSTKLDSYPKGAPVMINLHEMSCTQSRLMQSAPVRQHQQSRSCHVVVPAAHSVDPGVVAAASVTRSPCSLDNRQHRHQWVSPSDAVAPVKQSSLIGKNHCHSRIIHAAPVRQHQQSRSRHIVHTMVHTQHTTLLHPSISNAFWAALKPPGSPGVAAAWVTQSSHSADN